MRCVASNSLRDLSRPVNHGLGANMNGGALETTPQKIQGNHTVLVCVHKFLYLFGDFVSVCVSLCLEQTSSCALLLLNLFLKLKKRLPLAHSQEIYSSSLFTFKKLSAKIVHGIEMMSKELFKCSYISSGGQIRVQLNSDKMFLAFQNYFNVLSEHHTSTPIF